MRCIMTIILLGPLLLDMTCLNIHAMGLLPETVNQITIHIKLNDKNPVFYVIFSETPLDSSIKREDLQELLTKRNRRDRLVLKLHGKPMESGQHISYFFGTANDGDKPWNSGLEFDWKAWSEYSPDIWDNIAIAYEPPEGKRSKASIRISQVVIRRGGKLLLDTGVTESYPNKTRIAIKLPSTDLLPSSQSYPLLELGKIMASFRTAYYELKGPTLENAYADLGQTDKNKYAKRGTAWCSEFASHVLRESGILTPDPNTCDVNWKSLREFFESNGKVYNLREVASWPDSKKIELIKPGSVVSFLTNEGRSTHTVLFTTWIHAKGRPISHYTGISGCNQGMVWAHAPLALPTVDWAKDKSAQEIVDFDSKCFFGIPKQGNQAL